MIKYVFYWEDKHGNKSELVLRSASSDEDAMQQAALWGWEPKKWYKPRTWNNLMYCYKG